MQEQVIVIPKPNSLVTQSPPPLNSDDVNEDEDEEGADDDKIDHDDHPGVEMLEISPPLNGTLKIAITLPHPNIAGSSHQNPMFLEKEESVLVQKAGKWGPRLMWFLWLEHFV